MPGKDQLEGENIHIVTKNPFPDTLMTWFQHALMLRDFEAVPNNGYAVSPHRLLSGTDCSVDRNDSPVIASHPKHDIQTYLPLCV